MSKMFYLIAYCFVSDTIRSDAVVLHVDVLLTALSVRTWLHLLHIGQCNYIPNSIPQFLHQKLQIKE